MSALCRLSDLAATGAKELVIDDAGRTRRIFVVRHEAGIAAYFNACPHARLPLNSEPDKFLDAARGFLLCMNHGAHFDAATGRCFRGPCKGESLARFPIRIVGEDVFSADPDFSLRA